MGDLNAEPQSDEIRYLGGYTRLGEERTVRFTDVWSYGVCFRKEHNFEKYCSGWDEILSEIHEKYGSWETREGYKSWILKEVI